MELHFLSIIALDYYPNCLNGHEICKKLKQDFNVVSTPETLCRILDSIRRVVYDFQTDF